MTDRTGAGDPVKVIPLLWGKNRRRIGRRGVTLEAILASAGSLADSIGIANLSMRKLADELGIGTMTLYAYVPAKAELLDLMVDHAFAEVTYDREFLEVQQWREALGVVAERNWALYRRHPWLLDVDTSRPPLGPGTIGKYDSELRALAGSPLDDVQKDQVLTLVLEHVASTARLARDHADETSDAQWWATAGPLLSSFMNDTDYPYASRIGAAAGREFDAATDPARAYDFGLATILDGVDTLIGSRD